MNKTLTVRIKNNGFDRLIFVHRFRNFGEEVWRWSKGSGLAEVNLHEIDTAEDWFMMRGIKSRSMRRVIREVEHILISHRFEPSDLDLHYL